MRALLFSMLYLLSGVCGAFVRLQIFKATFANTNQLSILLMRADYYYNNNDQLSIMLVRANYYYTTNLCTVYLGTFCLKDWTHSCVYKLMSAILANNN